MSEQPARATRRRSAAPEAVAPEAGTAHAKVRRAAQQAPAREPVAVVQDVLGDPVEGVEVEVYVGGWRTDRMVWRQGQVRAKPTVAYTQRPGVSMETDSSGRASFPPIEEWGLEVPDSRQARRRERRESAEQKPDPVDPRYSNPYVLFVARLENSGTTWFGAERARYNTLVGVDREPPFPNDDVGRGAPPVIVLDKKRLQHQVLSEDEVSDPGDRYGTVTAWHAVPRPDSDGLRNEHRLFVEVYAAEPSDTYSSGGDNELPYPSVDAIDQQSVNASSFLPRDQHHTLRKGTLGVEVDETEVTVPVGQDSEDINNPTLFRPLVTNPAATGPHTFALSTAFRFIEQGEETPLYALLPEAFHTNSREASESESGDDTLNDLLYFVKSAIGIGLSLTRYDTLADLYSLMNSLMGLTGGDDSGGGTIPVGLRLGDFETDPNDYDAWKVMWDVSSSPDDTPVFAAVQEVPVRFNEASSTSVVFKGSWQSSHHPGGDDVLQDLMSFKVEIDQEIAPSGGGV
jgi:hypothetical protein